MWPRYCCRLHRQHVNKPQTNSTAPPRNEGRRRGGGLWEGENEVVPSPRLFLLLSSRPRGAGAIEGKGLGNILKQDGRKKSSSIRQMLLLCRFSIVGMLDDVQEVGVFAPLIRWWNTPSRQLKFYCKLRCFVSRYCCSSLLSVRSTTGDLAKPHAVTNAVAIRVRVPQHLRGNWTRCTAT